MRNSIDRKILLSKIIMGIGIALVVVSVWKFIFEPVKKQYNLKVGDVYYYEFNEDNPFEKTKRSYYRVLDKKDGFVQYVNIETGDTSSSKVRVFLFGSEKMEKK